jgi:hypothetical protein
MGFLLKIIETASSSGSGDRLFLCSFTWPRNRCGQRAKVLFEVVGSGRTMIPQRHWVCKSDLPEPKINPDFSQRTGPNCLSPRKRLSPSTGAGRMNHSNGARSISLQPEGGVNGNHSHFPIWTIAAPECRTPMWSIRRDISRLFPLPGSQRGTGMSTTL